MNYKSKFLVIISFLGILLSSCSNDDNNKLSLKAPQISKFEYGGGKDHSTDKIAYKGSDIHMEATINAEAKVKSISVNIHGHDLTPAKGEQEWDFKKTFTDSKYLAINPTFHGHIDIPKDIPSGEYHVVLTVEDEAGNKTEAEGELQIVNTITLSNFAIDASVVRGKEVHAEFMINAVYGIHNISVDIHSHGLTPAGGEQEWDFEKAYEGNYHGKTKVEFHEHIDVPNTAPAGKYHALFTVKDEKGNVEKYETHIDVTAK